MEPARISIGCPITILGLGLLASVGCSEQPGSVLGGPSEDAGVTSFAPDTGVPEVDPEQCSIEYRVGTIDLPMLFGQWTFPIVSDGRVFVDGASSAEPEPGLFGSSVLAFEPETGVSQTMTPDEGRYVLVDAFEDRVLVRTDGTIAERDDVVLIEAGHPVLSLKGDLRTGFERRNRWVGRSVVGFLNQAGTASTVYQGNVPVVGAPSVVHLTIKEDDVFQVQDDGDTITIDRWSFGSGSPFRTVYGQFSSLGGPVFELWVTEQMVTWEYDGQLWRVPREGGGPEPLDLLAGSPGGCTVEDAQDDTVLILCGSMRFDEDPLGQELIALLDDGSVRTVRPEEGWIEAPRILFGRELVWMEYESVAVFAGVDLGEAVGELTVHDLDSGSQTRVAEVAAGCLSCGAYWPAPWVDADRGIAAWNYPIDDDRDTIPAVAGYLSRTERCDSQD